MAQKIFTVEEANAILPRVRIMVEEMMLLRAEALVMRPDVWPILEKAVNNGGSSKAGELFVLFSRFQKLFKQLYSMGCELKGLQDGLIDFPSMRNGQKVYLCWRYNEPEITHWHPIDAGFSGRQPL
jgi:hypothetical protein